MKRNERLKKQVPLSTLCVALEQAKVKDGFSGVWFEDLINLVAAVCIDDDELSDADAFSICRDAAFNAAKSTITADTLEAEIGKGLEAFRKTRPRTYIILTSISVEHSSDLASMSVRDARLDFLPRTPKGYDRTHVPIAPPKRELRYCTVLVRITGRSPFRSYERGMAVLNLVRGNWNLAMNANVWSEGGQDSTAPLNVVLPGSIHTLHNDDGTRATDAYWFEPFPVDEDPIPAHDAKWKKGQGDGGKLLKAVEEANYRADIESIIVRYCRALDSRDPIRAFLQLWSVLETATGIQGPDYATMIDRLAYLYSEPERYRHVLELLREKRNQATHFGVTNEYKPRTDLVRLHSIAADCLMFLIRGGKFYRSIQEIGTFLSLPSDKDALERRIALTEEALTFKRHRPQEPSAGSAPPPLS